MGDSYSVLIACIWKLSLLVQSDYKLTSSQVWDVLILVIPDSLTFHINSVVNIFKFPLKKPTGILIRALWSL